MNLMRSRIVLCVALFSSFLSVACGSKSGAARQPRCGCADQENASAPAGGVDVHMHATLPGEGDMSFTPERALVAARSVGLQRAVAVGNGYYPNTTEDKCRVENDFLLDAARKDPARIAAAIAVPANADWALQELRRMHGAGARIVKLHALASKLDLRTADGASRFDALLSEAEALDMTALVHGNFPGPEHAGEGAALVALLNRHPKLRVIVAHLLGPDAALLPQLTSRRVFADVSGVIHLAVPVQRQLVAALRAFGVERVLFGSDWPAFHPAETIHALREMGLSESELRVILTNGNRALGDLFQPAKP
ncbi:MAG: amidohydrolase family protein [Labilithrix sp.]|nr:amidohydrolase family protein [Labilithrix sp.]